MITNKKTCLIKRIVIAISLSLTFFIVGCSVGVNIINKNDSSSNSLVDKVIKTLKDEWYSKIFYGDCDSEDALIAQFISSITNFDTKKQLDPYTYIIKNTSSEDVSTGKMGIKISNMYDYPVVTSVDENSPADGKLQVNDIIYGIGKENEKGEVIYHYISEDEYGFSSLIKYGEGNIDDKTYVKYARLDENDIYQNQEAIITLKSINSNIYAYKENYSVEDTLFVKLTGFTVANNVDYTTTQFEEILENNKNFKNLVIDLRDNGGGSLESVINVCDLFLPKKSLVVSLEKKDGSIINYFSKDDKVYNFDNYIILQNGNTASASEILIKTMQYYFKDSLTLIGTRSFGKGIAQRSISLNDKYSMQYTFAKWLAPDNSYMEYKDGIEANIKVEKNNLLTTMQTYYYALSYNENNQMKFDTVSNNNIYLSRILKEKGYNLRTDGYFDGQYQNVIKEFQNSHNILESGVVDENTFFYLIDDFINEKETFDNKTIDCVRTYLS